MPLTRWARAIEQQEAEERAEAKRAVEERILALHDDLDTYQTDAWRKVEELLAEEQKKAFTDIMNGSAEDVMLARERARLISRLLNRRTDLETELTQLREQHNELKEAE